MKRLIKFIRALNRWYRGGKQLLPEAIIEMRHSICQGCPHLKNGWIRSFCKLCSCTISEKETVLNKLAHPCEQCPIGNWSEMVGLCDEDNNPIVEQECPSCPKN